MRKRGLNPIALIVSVVVTIISFFIALACKSHFFAGSSWDLLLFWVVFIVLAGTGVFLAGRYLNKGGR